MTETRQFGGKTYYRFPQSFWTKVDAETKVKKIRSSGELARVTLRKFSTFVNFPRTEKKKTGTEYTVWVRKR